MLEADCNQSEDEQSLQHDRRPLKRNRGRYDKPQANAIQHSWSSDEEPEPDQEPAMALDNLDDGSEEQHCNQNDGDPSVQLDPALSTATPSVPAAETESEFASRVWAEFVAREAELARDAQPDVDSGTCFTFPSRDNVRWAELASALVDRSVRHLQSLPGTVTHMERAQAVELAKKDVEAARGICTVLPPSLQLHFRGRLAAAESALAQQLIS